MMVWIRSAGVGAGFTGSMVAVRRDLMAGCRRRNYGIVSIVAAVVLLVGRYF